MTTETQDTIDPAAEWAAGVTELQEKDSPPPEPKDTEPAPSTEGVVTSGPQETTPAEPAPAEQPKAAHVNLGGLSTPELLQRVKDAPNDPDTMRALEIRLKRLDSQARPTRERSKAVQAAATAAKKVREATDKARTDYPELAETFFEPFSEFADTIAQPMIEAEERAGVQSDEAVIEDAFPGFNKLRAPGSPLAQWLQSQPRSVQEQATMGGVSGGMLVLEQYEQHELANGRPSPFAPPAPATQPSVTPTPTFDPAAKAAQIKAEREKRLTAASTVPNGARLPAQTQETSARASWLAGVEEARRINRTD